MVVALSFCAQSAHAQGNDGYWWDGIKSFGTPDYNTRPKAEKAMATKEGDPDDLRPGDVPLRSDEMISFIDSAIERYRQIVSKGGWPKIGGTKMIRPGDDDERMPVVRRVLRMTGDYKTGGGSYFEDYNYDSTTEEAVRRFQMRHGLRTNGRIDRPTLAALSVSAEERLQQLELNRRRIVALLEQAVEDRYVLVNAAGFQLEAVERFEVHQRHRVIVGRQGRETPELRATIKALNFFPFWRVPDSVAKLDVFPRLVKEPQYLQQEGIRVVMGDFNGPEIDPSAVDWSQADPAKVKLRQDPGDKNALGLVRIDMQNEHGVYMHDTPLKNLFTQSGRAFSAGCVRVQDVFRLVEWLAKLEPGWESPGQVEAVIQSGQPLTLDLTRPVPVYFAYVTAWAEQGGQVQFRADIYNRDGQPTETAVVDPEEPVPSVGLAP
ncbi:MAG: L,D-transpeptidase family protein [Hyphomicrobium sp.]|nr:L,D-transpeptidase family protein [Hyphomicrobium sp.]